jgi:PKD repeat protein
MKWGLRERILAPIIPSFIAAALVTMTIHSCHHHPPLPITLSFTAAPTTGVAPLAVAFQALAVTGDSCELDESKCVNPGSAQPAPKHHRGHHRFELKSWTWDFGDGQTGEGKQVSHTYTQTGIYSPAVTLTFYHGNPVVTTNPNYITVTAAGEGEGEGEGEEGEGEEGEGEGEGENAAPLADAGPNQTVLLGATVYLDGSASSDPDGDSLTYLWAILATPSGSQASLSDPTDVKPSFVADLDGQYIFQLIVNDGTVQSEPDRVIIITGTAPDTAPVANAGPDQTVQQGALVALDGSASHDAENDPLTYVWSFAARPEGSHAALSDPTAAAPSFTADIVGTFVVQLVVNDGTMDSKPDTVTITTSTS